MISWSSPDSKVHGANMGPPGSSWKQVGLLLAPCTLLSGSSSVGRSIDLLCSLSVERWFNSLRPSDSYLRQLSDHHCFRWRLVAWSAPSHYLNQCWNIVNWTLGNQLQCNCNPNSNIFIQENAFKNVGCEMAFICLGLNVLKMHIFYFLR